MIQSFTGNMLPPPPLKHYRGALALSFFLFVSLRNQDAERIRVKDELIKKKRDKAPIAAQTTSLPAPPSARWRVFMEPSASGRADDGGTGHDQVMEGGDEPGRRTSKRLGKTFIK